MAFGQQIGPPATARQLQELLGLLQEAGYGSFREARGPMGFNQRQGGGKFTNDEASALIDQLTEVAQSTDGGASLIDERPKAVLSATDQMLRKLPAKQLAEELERRGWVVVGP